MDKDFPREGPRHSETSEERASREEAREKALNKSLCLIEKRGRAVRSAFDQLVIDLNPDHGPDWLDRIIAAKRCGEQPRMGDARLLALAVEGLDAIL